jgi:glutamyl-Q tRNA(Asp) synthetase
MITRFAPSPTGPLHLGHAFSALSVWKTAAQLGGTALLRIEDTDSTRARAEHEAGIYEDLSWLGLSWPTPVLQQSDHYADYRTTLDRLAAMDLLYPCSCTRRDILDTGAASGVDGFVYPGTCADRPLHDAHAADGLRLNIRLALARVKFPLTYFETGKGTVQEFFIAAENLIGDIGDPILRRKDTGDPVYHLVCVHDDARQRITHVVRGTDLQALTPLHVLIQRLLGFPTPIYHHHRLILDANGKRLAKIEKSKALTKFRAEGLSPADIKQLIGFKD